MDLKVFNFKNWSTNEGNGVKIEALIFGQKWSQCIKAAERENGQFSLGEKKKSPEFSELHGVPFIDDVLEAATDF